MAAPIALLTDFGLADPFVGQVKAVLATQAPEARLIDVCHEVEPFRLEQAGFFVRATARWLPPGTVFLAVVDPGVGSNRRIVCLEKGGRLYLAPDNGLLSLVLAEPGQDRAWDLSEHALAPGVSDTFHGRDVFAPLAARLANGESPGDLGAEAGPGSLLRLPWSEPRLENDLFAANVLHVDRFGNVILGASSDPWHKRLLDRSPLAVASPVRRGVKPATAYADLGPDSLGLFRGSQGFLELAANRDSAARILGVGPGAEIVLRLAD